MPIYTDLDKPVLVRIIKYLIELFIQYSEKQSALHFREILILYYNIAETSIRVRQCNDESPRSILKFKFEVWTLLFQVNIVRIITAF